MKKFLFLILLTFISCDNSGIDNLDDNLNKDEFALLFPEDYPITSFEMENGKSIVFHEKYGNTIKISLVNNSGKVEWTKEHNLITDVTSGNCSFIFNNLIYLYTGVYGINKYVFDFNGNLLKSESLSNEEHYYMIKDNDFLYAVKSTTSNNPNQINYIKYSLTGDYISELSFSEENISYSDKIIIKNNKIYLFGTSESQTSTNVSENYFCKVLDLNGNFISIISTEISDQSTPHSKLILDNGNILMSIYNFSNVTVLEGYELRLFNEESNLLNSLIIPSYQNALRLDLLSGSNIGLAGGKNPSSSELKLSQFTILDKNLNEIYHRSLGSYDNGEVFFKTLEYNNYYYLLGRTDGTNGDFDLPNNSTTSDMFLYRLNK